MQDHDKTQDQLINELNEMRRMVAELEAEVKAQGAEKKLRESERKYRMLFNISPIGITLVNLKGEILEVNRSILEMLGSPGPGATKAINMLTFPPLVEAGISDLFRTCMMENRPIDTELFYTSKWGKRICMRSILTPMFDEQGCVEGCLAVMEDVMPRKLAEQALRVSEEKYKALIETTDTGYLILDSQGKVTDANTEYLRLSGHRTLDEIIDRSVVEWTAEHDRERNTAEVTNCLQQGYIRGLEIDYVDHEGRITPVEINATVLGMGESKQIVALCRDITERKHTEAELRKSEERFSKSFMLSPDSISISRLIDGKVISVNQGFCRIIGYDESEIIGRDMNTFKLWVNLDDRNKLIELVKQNGSTRNLEAQFYTKGGDIIDGLVSSSVFELDGEDYLVNIMRDVTEQKRLQEAIRVSEEQYRAVFDNASVGINIVDFDGKMVATNRAFQEMLGYTGEELKGKSVFDITALEDNQTSKDSFNNLKEGIVNSYRLEKRYIRKDGGIIWIDISISAIKDASILNVISLGIFKDITERKQAEDALRESQTRYRTLFESLKDLINMHSEMLQNASPSVGSRTLPDVSKNLEMNYIENALRKTRGKIQPAAKLLGISRFTLIRQMAKMGIKGDNYK